MWCSLQQVLNQFVFSCCCISFQGAVEFLLPASCNKVPHLERWYTILLKKKKKKKKKNLPSWNYKKWFFADIRWYTLWLETKISCLKAILWSDLKIRTGKSAQAWNTSKPSPAPVEQLNWSPWLRSEALNVCFFVWMWSRFCWRQQVSGLDLLCMNKVTKKLRSNTRRQFTEVESCLLFQLAPSLPTAMFLYNTSAGCHNSRPSSLLHMCLICRPVWLVCKRLSLVVLRGHNRNSHSLESETLHPRLQTHSTGATRSAQLAASGGRLLRFGWYFSPALIFGN